MDGVFGMHSTVCGVTVLERADLGGNPSRWIADLPFLEDHIGELRSLLPVEKPEGKTAMEARRGYRAGNIGANVLVLRDPECDHLVIDL